jgi:hypothetical protein
MPNSYLVEYYALSNIAGWERNPHWRRGPVRGFNEPIELFAYHGRMTIHQQCRAGKTCRQTLPGGSATPAQQRLNCFLLLDISVA